VEEGRDALPVTRGRTGSRLLAGVPNLNLTHACGIACGESRGALRRIARDDRNK